MSNFITHNVSRLATFSGRDTRSQFWPYAGTIFVLHLFASFVVMSVQMGPAMTRLQGFALAHPELTNGEPIDASKLPDSVKAESMELARSFTAMMGDFAVASEIMAAITVLLYAAAVARRLHDRSMSALWGLLPLPFLTFGMIAMPRLMRNFAGPQGPDLGLFGLLFLNNVIYIVMLVILIVFLAKRSDPAINRYGPPPAGA